MSAPRPAGLSAVAIAILAALGGCTNTAVTAPPYDPPVIKVTRYDLANVALSGNRHGLRPAARRELRETITVYGEHKDGLHVTLLGGTAAQRQDARRVAVAAGVPEGNVANGGPLAKGGHSLLAAIESYVALPPNCRQRVLTGAGPDANFIDSGFGCATLVDLALSVADPKDLIGRPGVVLQDGARAARPVDAYRRFADDDGVAPIAAAVPRPASVAAPAQTEPQADVAQQ